MAENLLDYVTSLHDQGNDGNSQPSIYELVQKWKKENPDRNKGDNKPEEVEETEVTESSSKMAPRADSGIPDSSPPGPPDSGFWPLAASGRPFLVVLGG